MQDRPGLTRARNRMLFNSAEFIFFFTLVTAVYFLLPYRWRWVHLLAASCYFYMLFIPIYILILGFTIVVDYVAGILIEEARGRKRKTLLFLSLAANIGVLAVFKYYNFFVGNLSEVTRLLNIDYALPFLSIVLPVGLSFHTFQAMSYTIEVYRGRQRAERHFGIYALYVMFYPQLVAGPIERPQNLLHQFYARHDFDARRVSDGLRLMLWGMFKKVVIADNLAVYVNVVYGQPREWDGLNLIVATIFFSYQIYCDFSGYSDIAIGAAQVMGFKLMTNFNRPSHARTVSEFWKRWHISLTTWLRDYVFAPLSRRRGSPAMRAFNTFLVFLIIGIWHGANWTFVMYGAINGFYLLFGMWTAKPRREIAKSVGLTARPILHHIIKILITFSLVTFSAIFFRANNMTDAAHIVQKIARSVLDPMQTISAIGLPVSRLQFVLCLGAIIFLELVQMLQGKKNFQEKLSEKPIWLRWAFYYALILAVFSVGRFGGNQFIYFQF